MKSKDKYKYFFCLLQVMCVLSCTNNEWDNDALTDESLTGLWYSEETRADGKLIFDETIYTSSGTLSRTTYSPDYGYASSKGSGTYVFNGNSLTTNVTTAGQPQTLQYTVNSASLLHFQSISNQYGTKENSRIIGTLNMLIDEEAFLDFDAYLSNYTDARPEIYSYESLHPSIATVNEIGTVKAVGIGTTYIKVNTSAGIIVCKISVTSETESWDDYTVIFGEDLGYVENKYGQFYYEKTDSSISYYINNYYVKSVDFYLNSKKTLNFSGQGINDVEVTLNEGITSDAAVAALGEKYKLIEYIDSTNTYIFSEEQNSLLSNVQIYYDKVKNIITYESWPPGWDDYFDLYGKTFYEVISKRKPTKYEFNKNATYKFSSNIVDYVEIGFDQVYKKMENYQIYFNSKIANDEINNYLLKHYVSQDNISYSKNKTVNNLEYRVIVQFNKFNHSLYFILKKQDVQPI